MKKTLKKKNPYVELNPELKTNEEVIVYYGYMSPPTRLQEELFEELKKKNCSTKIYKSSKRKINEEDDDFLTNLAFGNVRVIDSLEDIKEELSNYKHVTYYIDEGLDYPEKEDVYYGLNELSFNDLQELKNNLHSSLVNEAQFVKELIELEESIDLNEGLSVAERMKRANNARSHAAKLKNARKRAIEKRSSQKVATSRARKMAISTLKKIFSANRKNDDLSPAEKSRIEDIIARRKNVISTKARRLIKHVRDIETKRLSKNEEIEIISEMYDGIDKSL